MCGLNSSIAFADGGKIAVEPDTVGVMSHVLQRGNHVIFSTPGLAFQIRNALDVVRRNQVLMHEHDDAKFGFGFEFHNGIR